MNPFTDYGFKMIFGQEANKDILIFFLNELLKGERHIVDLTFLDKEQPGDVSDDRSLIYDVFCKTDTGEFIIVEMQNREQEFFMNRTIYYMSRAVSTQGRKGVKWNFDISAVYGVFFMNFTSAGGLDPKLRTDVVLADRETGRMVSSKMRFIYLQLPYFKKNEDECENDFERMIYVLKKMEVLTRMPFEKRSFIFEKLAKIAEVRKLTKEEEFQYEKSLNAYRNTRTVYDTAVKKGLREGKEQGLKEGKEQGLKEGLVKGKEQGLKEGLVKGKEQGLQEGIKHGRIETARNFKELGVDIDTIVKATGLTREEIETL